MSLSDRAFHALAQHEPEVVLAALRVLCPDAALGAAPVRPDDLAPTRLNALAPPLDADWVAWVGDDGLIHLECQGYRDTTFPDRVFRYHLVLVLRHPERRVRTVALWLLPPPAAQRRRVIARGDVRVRVTHVVLGEVDAEALLHAPSAACFAAGADAGGMSDEALCARVAAALVAGRASWYQRHMAVITALSKGRYDAMTRAMAGAGMEPIIIEDLVFFGEDRGEARGIVKGQAKAVLQVADLRGLSLTEAQRARVLACTDLPTLEAWLTRAVTAASAEDILRDDA
jgi:hypothetical protein